MGYFRYEMRPSKYELTELDYMQSEESLLFMHQENIRLDNEITKLTQLIFAIVETNGGELEAYDHLFRDFYAKRCKVELDGELQIIKDDLECKTIIRSFRGEK